MADDFERSLGGSRWHSPHPQHEPMDFGGRAFENGWFIKSTSSPLSSTSSTGLGVIGF